MGGCRPGNLGQWAGYARRRGWPVFPRINHPLKRLGGSVYGRASKVRGRSAAEVSSFWHSGGSLLDGCLTTLGARRRLSMPRGIIIRLRLILSSGG